MQVHRHSLAATTVLVALFAGCGDNGNTSASAVSPDAASSRPAQTARPTTTEPSTIATTAASTRPPSTESPTTAPSAPPTTAAGAPVRFSATFGPPAILTPSCDGAQQCIYPISRNTTVLTGDVYGTTASAGAGAPRPDGTYDGVGIHWFTGEVTGCGSGTAVWTEVLAPGPDMAAVGRWEIAVGSGTGGLETLTGGGTFRATQEPDGSGSATIEGVVEC